MSVACRLVLVVLLAASFLPAAGQSPIFPNRVAAGDVDHDRAVLWARRATPGTVLFRCSRDPEFRSGVHLRIARVRNPAVPAKVLVGPLVPGSTYHYEVGTLFGGRDRGVFRTPHRPDGFHGLVFGVSGDARGDLAPYPSILNVPASELAFFAHLGDTIYADVPSPVLPGVQQVTTLDGFRAKHHEVNAAADGLNALGDLRASTALLVTIDDHEVTNDFSGAAPPSSDPRFDDRGVFINETRLFRNGLRAFVEWNPVLPTRHRFANDPRTDGKPDLYRARTYGLDAAVFLLDARSFRDQALPEVEDLFDPVAIQDFLAASFDPARTMLGRRQVERLKSDLLAAQERGVRWKFVMVPEPIQNLGPVLASDRFEGYAAERTEILQFIHTTPITNVVFVAADIHGTVVNDLFFQTAPDGPQIPVAAFEITTGAIAYDAPFGPTVIEQGVQQGFISPSQQAQYEALSIPERDELVKNAIDAQLVPLGYDPVGIVDSLVPATLLQGDWVSLHTYGWTAFEIAADTGVLTVTTWGIDPDDQTAAPTIRQRFSVTP